MPAGRPSKYNEKLLAKCRKYVNGDYFHHGAVFPSKIGLSLYIKISSDTLNRWSHDPEKPEFSTILDEIERIQHEMLVGHGIQGDYQPTITKVILTKHGYSDKQEIAGAGGKALIPDDDERLARKSLFAMARLLQRAEEREED